MAVPPNLIADPVAEQIAPEGVVAETAVTFRGWLATGAEGAPLPGGVYRFYTSPWFDEWLDVKSGDILYQQPGSGSEERNGTSDGSSIIWVKREAQLAKCQAAKACHFGEQEEELAADPTAEFPAARRYPPR